jgi:exonuclease VII small subunit
MITLSKNANQDTAETFGEHMAALERLRKSLERGDLDPMEALAMCRLADAHYEAVDVILARVETEIEQMQAAAK